MGPFWPSQMLGYEFIYAIFLSSCLMRSNARPANGMNENCACEQRHQPCENIYFVFFSFYHRLSCIKHAIIVGSLSLFATLPLLFSFRMLNNFLIQHKWCANVFLCSQTGISLFAGCCEYICITIAHYIPHITTLYYYSGVGCPSWPPKRFDLFHIYNGLNEKNKYYHYYYLLRKKEQKNTIWWW